MTTQAKSILISHLPTVATIAITCGTMLFISGGWKQILASHEDQIKSSASEITKCTEAISSVRISQARVETKVDILLDRFRRKVELETASNNLSSK